MKKEKFKKMWLSDLEEISIAIFLGIVLSVMFSYFSFFVIGEVTHTEKVVDCYDKHNNLIEGVTCVEEVTQTNYTVGERVFQTICITSFILCSIFFGLIVGNTKGYLVKNK